MSTEIYVVVDRFLYMSKLAERISTVIENMEGPERGRQTRLAKIANCSRGLVNQWLAGLNDSMGYEYAKNIANELGYSVEWLISGKPPMKSAIVRSLPTASADVVEILQYKDMGGAMGHGLILRDQPGEIQSWRVTPEWVQKNVPHNTGIHNLAIVTGFGPSMRPLFNPGDPLLVDRGITKADRDAIYFFRVGDEGFIKHLQRVPGTGLVAISENKIYRDWTITPDMDFEVFGLVLKVWKGEDF
jgi:transcriptional regulator with XRE-family HTH domain